MEFEKGQVVLSKAGRDKGRLLAAVRFDGKRVFLCDGKERPLERAKAKNLRHVEFTPMFLTRLQWKLIANCEKHSNNSMI